MKVIGANTYVTVLIVVVIVVVVVVVDSGVGRQAV